MQGNEQTDKQVAQYLRLYSCLFQTTVARHPGSPVRMSSLLLGEEEEEAGEVDGRGPDEAVSTTPTATPSSTPTTTHQPKG